MAKKNIKESKTVMPIIKRSKISVEEIYWKGSEAQTIYHYPTAIDYHTQASVAKDITAEFSSEILNQRAECCETMGQLKVKLDDLDKMLISPRDLKTLNCRW